MTPRALRPLFLALGVFGPAFVAAPPATASVSPPAGAVAAVAPTPPAKPAEKSDWVFSLLPKALQKNPPLEITVITEMTDAGKKLRPVTPQAPAYYVLHSTGYKQLGQTYAGEKSFPSPDIDRLLTHALRENGYLPGDLPARPPSLLIVYYWGTHNTLNEGDDENPSLSPSAVAANLLDRAALVGGQKFAKKLLELFQKTDAMNNAANVSLASGGEPPIPPGLFAAMNPVAVYKRSDPKIEALIDQAASDVYYVVASAYDYQSVATDKKILLWRTRMTVASNGLSQAQSLPTLVQSAAPYFGRDMPDSQVIYKRSVREGSVEVGPATVIESGVPDPAAAPKPPEKR